MVAWEAPHALSFKVRRRANAHPLLMEERQPNAPARAVRHRIEIKVSADQKARIERAAASQRKGLADFVRDAVETAVAGTLRNDR
jgi:hypothetical protein